MVKIGSPFFVSVLAGICVAVLVNGGIGLLCAGKNIQGAAVAIFTITIAEICRYITLIEYPITGGEEGISSLPFVISPLEHYYVALTLLVGSFVAMKIITKSNIGLRFMAIREDRLTAEGAGVNTTLYITLAFLLSSVFAGISGGYFALYLSHVEPTYFSTDISFRVLTMVAFGGGGTIIGPIIGAVSLTFLLEYLRFFIIQFRMIIYATILIVVLLLRPKGVVATVLKQLGNLGRWFRQKEESMENA
jgi:branched-chain amino acid transport system permease protein